MLVGPLILPAPIENSIKLFNSEGNEIEDPQNLGPEDLDDCEYPDNNEEFDEEKFRAQLTANQEAVITQNGYDLFLNYDDGGTTHLQFQSSDVLRGLRWGMKFFDEEDGTDYNISALYHNGVKIETQMSILTNWMKITQSKSVKKTDILNFIWRVNHNFYNFYNNNVITLISSSDSCQIDSSGKC